MVISNRAKRGPNEGNDHYLTKILIAELTDKYIGSLVTEAGSRLMILYEFQFKPLWVPNDKEKPRFYTGDVVLLIFNNDEDRFKSIREHQSLYTYADLQELCNDMMNIEIDGIVGHTGQHIVNNNIRDEELMKQCRIPVHRIESLDREHRKKYQEILKAEIEIFFFRHHPLVIN